MRQQFIYTLSEIEQDMADPSGARLETWRCKLACRRLKRKHTEAEIREVFVTLSLLDDFPPANFLWNADQLDIPLYCFLREKRVPVIRFPKMQIHRTSAKLTIEYGALKAKLRIRETIQLRRDWRGTMIVESRES